MSVFVLNWMEPPEEQLWGGAVTVGNFDGVHRGHVALVQTAQQQARRVGGPCIAVTFDPPPVVVLNPQALKPPLTTISDRVELLHHAGADHVVLLKADASLLSLSPEAFFEDVLLRFLGANAVVEGFNFRFGRGRMGDPELLSTLCHSHGLAFELVPPLLHDGELISSSRIRAALQAGEVELAAELLGRRYRVAAEVVTGARRGRTFGFPTANLAPTPTLVPGDGVYAVLATCKQQVYLAAANVGPAPTFGVEARKIEVHLLDFHGDLYGATLQVDFVRKLREVRQFSGLDALREQLQQDIQQAREVLQRLKLAGVT